MIAYMESEAARLAYGLLVRKFSNGVRVTVLTQATTAPAEQCTEFQNIPTVNVLMDFSILRMAL